MSNPTYITSNEAQISVSLTGVTFPSYIKTWKSFQGGDLTAATGQLQPGAGVAAVATPGPITRSNVVVTIPYTTDLHALRPTIEAAVNSAMTAGYVPVDADGNPNSDAQVSLNGLLKEPMFPNFDAANGEAVMMQLTMECNA
jgi:hypothetical protein